MLVEHRHPLLKSEHPDSTTAGDDSPLGRSRYAGNEVSSQSTVIFSPSPTPSLQPFRLDICMQYMATSLFPPSPNGIDRRHDSSLSWVYQALEGDENAVIHNAACSVAATFFARVHFDTETHNTGVGYYVMALKSLNENLKDDHLCRSSANVAASLLLVIYELLNTNFQNGWIMHAWGLQKLTELRGPMSFNSIGEISYFESIRYIILVRAILLRRRTFLEETSWRHDPWIGLHKSSEEHLADIMTFIPGLTEIG